MSCNTTDADLHSRVYTPPLIVTYRPLSFSREVRVTIFAGHLILLPSLGVYLMLLISKLLFIFDTSTFYGIECHSKERSAYMVFTHLIGFFSWSPTITTIN